MVKINSKKKQKLILLILTINEKNKNFSFYTCCWFQSAWKRNEATNNLKESIFHIKELNKKVGVSLNPDTKINVIESHLSNIDLVLVMSVFPGFGGQKFIPETINKIKDLKEIKDRNNFSFDIEVDGGINFSNSKDVISAGANILVSGTTIFKENNGDIQKNIETLKSV